MVLNCMYKYVNQNSLHRGSRNGYFIKVTIPYIPPSYAFVQWDWDAQELKKEEKKFIQLEKPARCEPHFRIRNSSCIIREKKENPLDLEFKICVWITCVRTHVQILGLLSLAE